jgi:hypothetical protein
VTLRGRLDAPFLWPGLTLPAGPLGVDLAFVGGAAPAVSSIALRSADQAPLDGLDGVSQPVRAVEALIDVLVDVAVRVEALPGEDLWVRIMPGLSATLPANALVVFDADTRGPAERPRLNRPLVVSIGGAGLSVRLPGARWVRILASVAIRRASLAPDGAVELHGVGIGLRRASHHLSDLVRRHPHFARVRSFLLDRDG